MSAGILAALVLLAALATPARAASAASATSAPEEAAKPAESHQASAGYVHRWLPLPTFRGPSLDSKTGEAVVAARAGKPMVILFLASWCEPCQQIARDFRIIEQRYAKLDADFVYVFAHDTRDDAAAFMREYGLPRGMLATYDVLKAFNNPELPTIYVADGHGWLTTRYVKAGDRDLASLDELLKGLTAL